MLPSTSCISVAPSPSKLGSVLSSGCGIATPTDTIRPTPTRPPSSLSFSCNSWRCFGSSAPAGGHGRAGSLALASACLGREHAAAAWLSPLTAGSLISDLRRVVRTGPQCRNAGCSMLAAEQRASGSKPALLIYRAEMLLALSGLVRQHPSVNLSAALGEP